MGDSSAAAHNRHLPRVFFRLFGALDFSIEIRRQWREPILDCGVYPDLGETYAGTESEPLKRALVDPQPLVHGDHFAYHHRGQQPGRNSIAAGALDQSGRENIEPGPQESIKLRSEFQLLVVQSGHLQTSDADFNFGGRSIFHAHGVVTSH